MADKPTVPGTVSDVSRKLPERVESSDTTGDEGGGGDSKSERVPPETVKKESGPDR